MNRLQSIYALVILLIACCENPLTGGAAAAPDLSSVTFAEQDGQVAVEIDESPVATYYFQDEKTYRPYFAHVRTPNGVQVTRNHPPVEGKDLIDHDAFHPGIWMAFGDINGADFWRNKATVRHENFEERPQAERGRGTFAVRNRYVDPSDPENAICNEVARYTFLPCADGYWLLWDSTFSSEREFTFGDQEEMGLGIRVATPLRVGKSGTGDLPAGNGAIFDAKGRKNGDQVGGNSADWCDYSGTIADQNVGVTLFCHPANFRPSWFHARDYGLLVANPFGRQAFGKGEKSTIAVRPGEKLRLRFGIFVHSGKTGSSPDWTVAYQDYLKLAGK